MKKLFKKKSFYLFAATLLLASLLTGCKKNEKSEGTAAGATDKTVKETTAETVTETKSSESEFEGDGLNQATVIHVGTQPGITIWELNKQKQFIENEFADDNIKIEYKEFTYGPPIIEAIGAGEIDISLTGDLPVFTGVANGIDVTGIYRIANDKQGYGILAFPESGIKTAADLKGKKVAVPVGSAGHNFLAQLLASVDLSISDIELVNLAAGDIAAALANGDVDAAALWESSISTIAVKIGAEIPITSDGVYESLNLIVARNEFAEKNPEITARFVKAVKKLEEYTQANPDEVVDILANVTGNPKEAWKTVYRVKLTGYLDDQAWASAEKAKQFLLDNDLIENDFDVKSIYTDKYLVEADRLAAK